MERVEIAELLGEIEVLYPNRIKFDRPEDRKMRFETFCRVLKDKDADMVRDNLMAHVEVSPHPPTVADLVKRQEKSVVPNVDETMAYLRSLEVKENTPEQQQEVEDAKSRIRKILDSE